MRGLVDLNLAVDAVCCIIIAFFAEFGIGMTITAARSHGAVGIASTVSTGVSGFSEVAFFAVFGLELAITAEWRGSHATGHTLAFAIGAVVDAVVADFAGIERNDAVAAGREFTFGRAVGAAVVVVSGTGVAFFALVGLDDAITAIPLACVGIAKRIAGGIAVFTGIDVAVAAQGIVVFAPGFVAARILNKGETEGGASGSVCVLFAEIACVACLAAFDTAVTAGVWRFPFAVHAAEILGDVVVCVILDIAFFAAGDDSVTAGAGACDVCRFDKAIKCELEVSTGRSALRMEDFKIISSAFIEAIARVAGARNRAAVFVVGT